MRQFLVGTALVVLTGLSVPASAQTGAGRVTVAPVLAATPIVGVPGGDERGAAVCTEIDLLHARDLIDAVPEPLRASARTIFEIAEEYQNDGNDLLCVQKLQELRALARSGIGGPAAVAVTGVSLSPAGVVAASCTETDLARVASLIDRAPESLEPTLRTKLYRASWYQDDGELLLCANTLAEIRALLAGAAGPALRTAEITPGVVLSPAGLPIAAAVCTEPEQARVADLISRAPATIQSLLRQRLAEANDHQVDEEFQLCAQELAQIRSIVEAYRTEAVAPR